MKKLLLLIFGIIVALPAMTQTGTQLVEISRIFKHVDINITPGLTYTWPIGPEFDTARYFQHNGKRYIATVTFTEIGAPPPGEDFITIIDNVDTRNVYSSGWTHRANENWTEPFNDKTVSITFVINGTLTLPFDGYKIEWWGEKRLNHGKVGVSIDNGPETIIDLYDPTSSNNSRKLFEWSGTSEQHEIKLRLTADKHPASTSINVVHDSFVVYSK